MKDFLKNLDDDLKQILLIGSFCLFSMSFIIGCFVGMAGNSPCKYDSIASRINIGYVLGCEITTPRFSKDYGVKNDD